MVRAENESNDVRNNETDVANGTADGNGKAGEKRGSNINHKAYTPDVHAKMHGFLLAGKKDIQIVGRGIYDTGSHKKARRQKPIDALLKRGRKVAHQPEDHAAGLLLFTVLNKNT